MGTYKTQTTCSEKEKPYEG